MLRIGVPKSQFYCRLILMIMKCKYIHLYTLSRDIHKQFVSLCSLILRNGSKVSSYSILRILGNYQIICRHIGLFHL